MSALQLLAVMFGLMLTLMAFRIPIAAAMFFAGGVGCLLYTSPSPRD
ncbi:MAG: C4-dicarboxylate ABC transporter permease, partial [Betaproteobacteria bacterium]|nr:C4-dicarboxylate ABC transporter permease [Betaproteobacteria bacterium]